MPVKIKPSVVRAALLGGVLAIAIALAAHFVPVVGWLSVPLALGTGALAAILGRHEPGPSLTLTKPSGGLSGPPPTPGTVPAADDINNLAGTAPASAIASSPTGSTGVGSGAATGDAALGSGGTAAGDAPDSGADAGPAGGSPPSPASSPLNGLIPPMSDGLVAGLLEGLVGALVLLSFLCCSDCLSFMQAAERGAFSRMLALIEQGFFDAVTVFGPMILGAAFGALGGALGAMIGGRS